MKMEYMFVNTELRHHVYFGACFGSLLQNEYEKFAGLISVFLMYFQLKPAAYNIKLTLKIKQFHFCVKTVDHGNYADSFTLLGTLIRCKCKKCDCEWTLS